MNKVKFFLISLIFFLNLQINSYSKTIPSSFADLAERLLPSVVNISTTTTVTTQSNPFPFQFPPEETGKEMG